MPLRLLTTAIFILTLAVLPHLLLGAPAAKNEIPTFSIIAKPGKAVVDLNTDPMVMVFEANPVKCNTPFNSTSITCKRLIGNAIHPSKITSVEAQDNVDFSMLIPPKEKSQGAVKLVGHSERMTMTISNNTHILRLWKEHDVVPVLNITNLLTKQTGEITGDEIIYNMDTRHVDVKDVVIGNQQPEGEAQ